MGLTGWLFKHQVGSRAVPGGFNSDHDQFNLSYLVAKRRADFFCSFYFKAERPLSVCG